MTAQAKKRKRMTIRDPRLRIATNRDCRTAMDIEVDVGELVKLPTGAVTILSRAHHARLGGGAVLRSDDRHVKACERAGLVVVRSTPTRGYVRVTLTTLCIHGHDTTNPAWSRNGGCYCKRCGEHFEGGAA